MTELNQSIDEPVCESCGHVSFYRLYFNGTDLFALCGLCGANYNLGEAMSARVENAVPPPLPPPPPPPPPPEKKRSFFSRKGKSDSKVKSPI